MKDETKEILTKRFQTTMIGSLFEFEKVFGYLWGQFKNDNEPLSAQEEYFLDKWDQVRNQILNNGNNQLRKALADLDKLNGSSVKYNYKFYKKGSDQ
jgi:hypothetical protein